MPLTGLIISNRPGDFSVGASPTDYMMRCNLGRYEVFDSTTAQRPSVQIRWQQVTPSGRFSHDFTHHFQGTSGAGGWPEQLIYRVVGHVVLNQIEDHLLPQVCAALIVATAPAPKNHSLTTYSRQPQLPVPESWLNYGSVEPRHGIK